MFDEDGGDGFFDAEVFALEVQNGTGGQGIDNWTEDFLLFDFGLFLEDAEESFFFFGAVFEFAIAVKLFFGNGGEVDVDAGDFGGEFGDRLLFGTKFFLYLILSKTAGE